MGSPKPEPGRQREKGPPQLDRYQGRGLLLTNAFGIQQLCEGRPGDSIAEMLSNTRSVIFRTGEWLIFTVESSSAIK